MNITLTCPCLFGLESVLSGEIKRMGGAENIKVTDGRVTFTGDISLIAKANICLRTAERVQILLGEFRATSFEELFQGVKKLPFEDFVGKKDAFPVKGWSINSQLHSIPDCQSIIKKAIVTRFSDKYNLSWFEETGEMYQVQFGIYKDNVLIMIDTSGAGLHKRGYRRNSTSAPIKETLAAGICDLIRIYPDSIVYDPFCGSGTFLIESAMHALRIAPGLRRTFTAEKWSKIDKKVWYNARQEAFDLIRRDAVFKAYGSDIDQEAIDLSLFNAKQAGVDARIKIQRQSVEDFKYVTDRATVITNPPYGERLLDIQQSEALYKTMGNVLTRGENKKIAIITPNEDFERIFGQKADKKRKLYNGMIKCQLFMYR